MPREMVVCIVLLFFVATGTCQTVCKPWEYKCPDDGSCIDLGQKWCDGVGDCADYSDEPDSCVPGDCPAGEVYLKCNKKCLPPRALCDFFTNGCEAKSCPPPATLTVSAFCPPCSCSDQLLECPSNCQTCTATTNGFTCTTCSPGHRLEGAQCVASCPANCVTCADSGSGLSCETCAAGYYLDGSFCTACPANCASCVGSGDSVACQSCSAGHVLDVNGNCLLAPACPDNCEHCWTETANVYTCTVCYSGYTLEGPACVACPANCAVCSSGVTGILCQTCATGYTLDGTTGTCTACPANCAVCSSGVTGISCQTCATGYTLDGTTGTCTA